MLRLAKSLQKVDANLSFDISEEVKREFRLHQNEKEKGLVSVLLREGNKKLEELEGLVRARGVDVRVESQKKKNVVTTPKPKMGWKGMTDEDGSDKRGRVGFGWPWQKDDKS